MIISTCSRLMSTLFWILMTLNHSLVVNSPLFVWSYLQICIQINKIRCKISRSLSRDRFFYTVWNQAAWHYQPYLFFIFHVHHLPVCTSLNLLKNLCLFYGVILYSSGVEHLSDCWKRQFYHDLLMISRGAWIKRLVLQISMYSFALLPQRKPKA